MNDDNKDSINQTIDDLVADDLTPIWDTIGEATTYAWNNHLDQHTPSVVAMTDGDDAGGTFGGVDEGGSDTYAPGARWSNDYGPANKTWNMTGDLTWNEEKTYEWNIARYRGDDDWDDIDINDGDHDPTRYGLVNSPVPTFNIGLGISPQGTNQSADNYLDPNKTVSDVGGSPSYVKSSAYAYNFTTEYDLQEIANSTGGNYHYAPTSSELIGIYENISKTIENIGMRWVGEEAPHGFNKVYLDAEELNVTSPITMYDDGNHGDGNANDNIYGTDYFTVKSEDTKVAEIEMFGEDHAGNINNTNAFVEVDNSNPVLNEKTINYPEGQDFVTEGQNISFKVDVEDEDSGIEKIILDASSIGGTDTEILKDDGEGKDEHEGDGVYTSKDISVDTGDVTGTFDLDLTIFDSAKNDIESSFYVQVDNIDDTPPSGTIANPSEGQIIKDDFEFKINAWDNVGVESVIIDIDGSEYQTSHNQETGYWTHTLDTTIFDDGEYLINAEIKDVNGHTTVTENTEFYIDNNGPSLSVNNPQEEEILSDDVNLSVNSDDEVGISGVEYWVDNSESVEMTESSDEWTATLNTTDFNDGEHVIHFKSEDEAGHVEKLEIQAKFDNSKPNSSLISPTNNEYIEDTYTFKSVASDEVGIKNVFLNINNSEQDWKYCMGFNSGRDLWEYNLDTTTLSEGNYMANVTVIDIAGHNDTSINVNFTIDNKAPSLSVNNPQEEEILSDDVNLSVNSDDEVGISGVEYWVDNSESVEMTESSDEWTATLNTTDFNDGNHLIHFKTEDEAGHVTSTQVSVVFDNTGPLSYIESPNEDEYIEGSYKFTAKATDEIGIENVTLNLDVDKDKLNYNMVYNPDTDFWEKEIDTNKLPEAEFNANVTAVDQAGHSYTSSDIKFYIDNTEPTMDILTPEEDEIISENHSVQINSEDSMGVSSVEYKIDNSLWKSLDYVPYGTGDYNWVIDLNTSSYSDGNHDIYFRTIDNAGHETKKKNEITIDNSDPVGNLTNPAHNEFIDGEFTFKAIAMDEVGVQSVIMDIEGDGYDQVHTLNYNENNGYWESLINTNNLPDGDKDLRLEIVDVAGHRTTYEKKFYVDNNAPDLGIKGPKMDEIISDEYDLEVNSSDLIGIKSVKYQIDGSSWVGLEENSELWTRTLDTKQLSDGQHTLKVKSTDMAGHTTEEKIKFIVDNDKPSISIVNPQDDQFIEDELKVQLKVDDNFGIKDVNVNIYSLVSDGNYSNKWTENATYNPSSGYYEISLDTKIESEEGVWRVNASTTDQAGHVSESNDVEFKVDNHKPSLTIHNPRDEDYIQGVVDLNYTAQDAFTTYTEYKVDDSGWVPAVVELDTTKLADGKHSIDVRTTDTAGKSVTQSMDVYVDNTEPTIEIASPIDDQFIDEWFKFKISANDDVGIEDVKLDVFNQSRELSYDSSSGYYIYEVDTRSVSDGTYNLTAIATDPIGNKNVSKQISFRVDNNKPDLTIHSPENEEYINGTIELNVTADDKFLKDVEYTVDNTGYVPIDQELETTKLSEGKHIISVRATDMNGQEKISEISVIVDNEVPKLRVVEPTPYEIVSGEQNIKVFAGQEIQNMTISMPELDEGAAKVMEPLQESESFQYLLNTSRLSDKKGTGRYNGTITAIDRAGHRRTTGFSIKVDNEGPHINKTDPGNKDKNSVKFSAIVDDWSEIDEVKINIDGKGWNEMIYSGNDTYIYNWDTSMEDNGNHTYTIKATDENGNVQTYSESVKVNNSREYWTILQNNVPGFSFIFLLIITLFLIYLTREEIADRLRREEEEDDEGKNGGSSSDEVDTDLMSRLKFSNLYSEKEKKESKKSGKMFGFLPGIGKKKKDKKQKKQLKTLKKVEKDKEDSEEDESSIEEEEPEKFDGLELNKTIINKLRKEDIRDIEDLSEYSVSNLKKYTDLENEEIQKIKTELEKKGYDIKEDKELMSSVFDAEL
ncbi:MAG: Ig-like domain-containing protein [Thermoplasmatota archaeon]